MYINMTTLHQTNQLKWLKEQQTCNFDTCILIHKIVQGNYPKWLLPVQRTGNTTGVRTRQNTETGARIMQIRGLVIWNELLANIRNISSQKTKKVREHLLKYQWQPVTYNINVLSNFVSQALQIYIHNILLHYVNTIYVNKTSIGINGIKCFEYEFELRIPHWQFDHEKMPFIQLVSLSVINLISQSDIHSLCCTFVRKGTVITSGVFFSLFSHFLSFFYSSVSFSVF